MKLAKILLDISKRDLTAAKCLYENELYPQAVFYLQQSVEKAAFSEEQSSELNIGDNYKVAILLTRHNTKPLLPFEIKPVGYDAEKIVENLSNIEKSLLTLVVEHPVLNKAIGYLYDSYTRLEENDVEGARTAVRNSLQVLRDEFLPEVKVTEEVESFREKMRGLINKLRDFVSYGGPHPGPAPRTTTEVVGVTAQIIEYLAKSIENRTLKI